MALKKTASAKTKPLVMSAVVDSHLLKLYRAVKHLDHLNVTLTDWFNSGHHTHWLEPDPNALDDLLIKASADEVPADPFALIIGDVVHNFRSCLDHLNYMLTSAYTNPVPEPMARDSQFPIIGDVNRKGQANQGLTMFQNQGHRIAGIDPRAKTAIERLQPYQRGKDFIADPLWILSELSNIDKHRILHLAIGYAHGFSFDPPPTAKFPRLTFPHAIAKSWSLTGAIATRDTVIGRIQIERLLPKYDVNVNLEIVPSIAFADGPLAHMDVLDTLREIQTHIAGDVLPKLVRFL